jgi:hypothetical protein
MFLVQKYLFTIWKSAEMAESHAGHDDQYAGTGSCRQYELSNWRKAAALMAAVTL